jgi:hypothetical protein
VRTERALYVGPDNGILTRTLSEPGAGVWELNRPEFWLPQVSRTFHGRDVFAPAAAHLANGADPREIGSTIADPVRLSIDGPSLASDGAVHGHVVHVDHFGNLVTDIPAGWLGGSGWRCRIAGEMTSDLRATYAEASRGTLVLLTSSTGMLEIAETNGDAARRLGAKAGEEVIVEEDTLWKG